MKKVQITETVLRDANQSLMATRLPYDDYAGILPEMDQAGYYSVECWGGATFDSCLRYLGEDPWERLRKLRANLLSVATRTKRSRRLSAMLSKSSATIQVPRL